MRRVYLRFGEKDVSSAMAAGERKLMIERHRHSLARFGYSPHALYWESREAQEMRFKVLSEIGIMAGDSLLDVGCGFGDLYDWLISHDLPVDYTGIDLSMEILDKGLDIHPTLNLQQGELFDFDWSLLSGTLSWCLKDEGDYARRVIRRMFELCRKGVAFNLLNSRTFDAANMGDIYAFDPAKIMKFCRDITPYCELHDGYLDYDFTIYMKRDP